LCGNGHGIASKKRDELKFETSKAAISELIELAKNGDIELAYCDESGFTPAHPNRNAWTEIGEVHCSEAKRGKRLNIMGALFSTGKLLTECSWNTTCAERFLGFLGVLMQSVTKPLTIILDNASIHKAKSIEPVIKMLKTQGLTLYFLPPYSPELNRIELLWHKMKYEWLAFKSRTSEALETDINEITNNFGTKYCFDFYSNKNGKI
jgi:transposase